MARGTPCFWSQNWERTQACWLGGFQRRRALTYWGLTYNFSFMMVRRDQTPEKPASAFGIVVLSWARHRRHGTSLRCWAVATWRPTEA